MTGHAVSETISLVQDDPYKAFDFAKEVVTQLIGLSTGIIALTITFAKDFLRSSSDGTRRLAAIAWGCFFLSLVFGIAALMALTGNLAPLQGPPVLSVRSSNIAYPASLQVLMFLAGLALTISFAIRGISADEQNHDDRSGSATPQAASEHEVEKVASEASSAETTPPVGSNDTVSNPHAT